MSLLVLSYIRKSRLPRLDRARLAQSEAAKGKQPSRWLLTYIDLFTALLGFFIFMIVQTGLEQSTPKRNYQKIVQDIYQHALYQKEQHNLDWLEVENTLSKGVRLTLQSNLVENQALFDSARAKINPSYLPYLRQVTDLIEALHLGQAKQRYAKLIEGIESEGYQVKFLVRIEGHTDSNPLAETAYFKDNVELSTYRAYAVQELVRLYTGLEKNLFSLAGYGSFRPIMEDSAADENRRVEIYILPQMVLHNTTAVSSDSSADIIGSRL